LILASIDIGSNAVRLLINEVNQADKKNPFFNKLNLFRVPLRLGFDVFEHLHISAEKTNELVQTLKAFRHLMNVYQVDHYKVCATSAMRDAKNAKSICATIYKETGLEIEIISGDMEAAIIYENHIAENLNTENSYMYIDVGGGSTEISIFGNGKLTFKKSFNIGTIRLLKDKVKSSEWETMKQDIKQARKSNPNLIGIGSGGNINKIFSMSKRKDGKPLDLSTLKDFYQDLSTISIEDRIKTYNLREDRADVIVPALLIYINAMRWADCDEIYVPKIGLADGLIQHLWEELKESKKV
jgi:exopolyphosphatase/guanosine-5'-triphosphate,3'-diphosphate pyrophosphatase